MYLKSIKLAGFKSFVDPTSLVVRSHMNAIVGPNGCGKSNIVDAIRWVIGESSAKQLRGQSMSDVIFNGTTQRKAVGRAMVELHFDNSAGRIGGEYAKYNDIVVRREVQREGQSSYFLNGSTCRRRDILDVFLGTGLGARSYSIIEQGMISQLVEAKPDEMRVHLEEVAGISKYKERRKETENRIRHTQENLDRLNDIREELDKQLRHLKRQANAAESYKVLKAEEREYSAQIKALNWQVLENKRLAQQEKINQHHTQMEQKIASQRECEAAIEKQQLEAEAAAEQHQAIQKNYYQSGEEIARLEQQIQHHQQQLQGWQDELDHVEQHWEELETAVAEYREQSASLTQELTVLTPQRGRINDLSDQAHTVLSEAEAAMRLCQQDWEQFQEESATLNRELGVARTKMEHQAQQQQKSQLRQQQLEHQLSQLPIDQLREGLQPQQQRIEQLQQQLQEQQQQLQQAQQQIAALRNTNQQREQGIQQARQALQQLESEQAKLSALQQTALGCNNQDNQSWLQQQHLSDVTRLGAQLSVKPGWEKAVETALSGYFDALCVTNIEQYADELSQLSAGRVTLVEQGDETSSASDTSDLGVSLLQQIESPCLGAPWLHGIYGVETLEQAMRLRSALALHESVITKDGVWLGKHWMRVSKVQDPQSGIIERNQALTKLCDDITTATQQLNDLVQQQKNALEEMAKQEALRDQLQTAVQALNTECNKAAADFQAQSLRFDNVCAEQQRLQAEITVITSETAHCQQQLTTLQQQQQALTTQQQQLTARREQLVLLRDQRQQHLQQHRHAAQQYKQQVDELEIRISANESQLALLQQSMGRDERQLTQLAEKRTLLSNHLSCDDSPLQQFKEALQQKLSARLDVEQQLKNAEQALTILKQQLNTLEKNKQQVLDATSDIKSQLDTLRLSEQEFTVRQQTIHEQLQEDAGVNLTDILANLPQEAAIDAWQERLDSLNRRIQRLGAINLAAIDEYQTSFERKTYLDQQFNDLHQALETLQTAIRKIDRESKLRFQETFDKVNAGFQRIFPQVFGGGSANLALSDDDLLTTGVLVKAQPPGKRNASIHMLSGGEKALTAISLVFAMFQLNPAPFCILDEVDAPLDDLNVGRFCQLVKQMSVDTQFLIISHNKSTIEKADHLLGVTMQEPGVSRLVAVDMQEALDMVEA